MRKWSWRARAAAAAMGTALAVTAVGTTASAGVDGWINHPVEISVPLDISDLTDNRDVERVTGWGYCLTPTQTSATWNGSGISSYIQVANTDNVTCRIDLTVQYCSWNVFIYSCGKTLYATRYGEAGPLHIDLVAPVNVYANAVGTSPNAAGWYRTPGTVQWYGSDALSGIYYCWSEPLSGPDTGARTVTGLCFDKAGNPSVDVPFTYKYDGTAPTLAPSVSGPLELGDVAYASPGASDALSGVASASCNGGAALDTSVAGPHTVTCTATDNAGNTATADLDYVVAYDFGGFGAPLDADSVNVANAGRAIPLKFHLSADADGTPLEGLDPATVKVSVSSVACDLGDTPNLVEETSAGAKGLIDLGGGDYQFTWSSPKSYAGSCKVLTLDVGDGASHTVEFAFVK